jgi:hypothetical protein
MLAEQLAQSCAVVMSDVLDAIKKIRAGSTTPVALLHEFSRSIFSDKAAKRRRNGGQP